jgi:DNA-binding FadR family transcriptional regulator
MRKHLTALHQELIHRQDGPRAEPVEATAASGQTGRTLARRIRADVMALGWPVGQNLGSETALLERYGASRSALREAVRILEHHAAVEMRRGPGGGLVVRAPDGEAVTRAAVLHLHYRTITTAALFEARDALEAATLRLATERLDDEGRALLAEALERTRDLRSPQFGPATHDFHVAIARLSGNQTLQLFVAILAEITAERVPGAPPSDRQTASARSARQQVDHAHRRIAEAVFEGDSSLALRRMRLHLRALECSIA